MALVTISGHGANVFESGAGRPLVLVHGLAGSAAVTWAAMIEPLSQHFHVIAYDARGAGGSEVTAPPYSLELLAEDLLALLEVIKAENAVLAGHSMGGTIALLATAADPSRVGAVIGAGIAFGSPDPRERADLRELADAAETHGMIAVADGMATLGTSPGFRESSPERYGAFVASIRDQPPVGFVARCRALAEFALDDQLDGVSIPVDLLASTNDPLSPLLSNRALAATLTAGTFRDLGEGAHEVMLEHPERVVAEIVRFTQSL